MSLHRLQLINAAALGDLRIDPVPEGKLMRVKADVDKGGERRRRSVQATHEPVP